jgi:hypothetical protein
MKLPLKDRVFWKNFWMAFGLFMAIPTSAAILIPFSDYGLTSLQAFTDAFGLLSTLAVLNVCYRIGMYFARSVEFNELRNREGLTWEEFRTKYQGILEIIRSS